MHVLILDGQDFQRISTKMSLRQLPIVTRISEALDGRQALAVAGRDGPDLVIVELNAKTGIDLGTIRSLRQELPYITIIALSPASREQEAVFGAGANSFVVRTRDSQPALLQEVVRAGHGPTPGG